MGSEKNPGIHFYSGFREKKHKGGGVQFEILINPGIDFYSGSRDSKKSRYRLQKKIQVYTFIVASEKKTTRGGGAIRNPKKSRYRLL